MDKPSNYDSISTGGSDYTPIELGGHYLIVKQVSEAKTKNGADKVVVLFDMDAKDPQAGYFKAQFDADTKPDKKWPLRGQMNIVTMVNGEFNRSLKSFIVSVEQSNPGFRVLWGDQAGQDWGRQFKGKKVGGVFGEVMNEYRGKTSKRRELRWFCKWDAVADAKVPECKPLKNAASVATTPAGFVAIPDNVDDDELPFG